MTTALILSRISACGFHQLIHVETEAHSFDAWCSPAADLDGAFEAIDEHGDRLRINGWTCQITVEG